ncbi:GyrI-like small molecule binding protein [Dokdonia sp. Hel_I_63]|uniref:GyrI-like domain-containing protein n=1 Tax=unclassified Dokdonia TaxID=2615033 RepID=UPI00020A62A4|nr:MULTISPECIES: GyrI-like domain-containing protein [unclassified Dokdonia]AEE19423.1 transcription activator effector binding protein [Dokdonia sp. 4H-3-7-5]TVZ21343.1 GyrI-like small molecule binding protein [Dokdonia sp. Hel_I_63]
MKKIIAVLLIGFIAVSGWYLFLKPGDFTAKIKAKGNLGTIEQFTKNWNDNAVTTAFVLEKNNRTQIDQKYIIHDSVHLYMWNIERLNDTVSEIKVHVKDSAHSFQNRLQGLWQQTSFEKNTRQTILDYNESLQQHLKDITITINGEATLPAKHYAYTEYEGLQAFKVTGMMRDITYLQNTMAGSNATLDGPPFIKITHWNRETDSIKYQFGFPIIPSDSLPQVADIKYGNTKGQQALKATYNGNYLTSDRAWYALIDYAKTNNIKIDPRPTEIFYNNPNMGGDASNWKAEIFIPIID